jgi:hypothetical protein
MSEPDSKLDQDRFSALRRAEASFRSRPSDPAQSRLIASAVDLLVLGFDTPNLRILAGEDSADTGEVSYYLNATLGDLGLRPLDDRAGVLMVLDEIAADLIDGRLEPADGGSPTVGHMASEILGHRLRVRSEDAGQHSHWD